MHFPAAPGCRRQFPRDWQLHTRYSVSHPPSPGLELSCRVSVLSADRSQGLAPI